MQDWGLDAYRFHARMEDAHWWFRGRRTIMRHVVQHVLAPTGDPLVVDVGCGTGGNVAALSDRYTVLGIDTSPPAIALAQARFPNLTFRCGLAPEAFGDRVEALRMVLLMDVLEHVEAADALLASLMAAVSPGTMFYVTVPAGPTLWSPHDVAHGHYRRYTLDAFRDLWTSLPVQERLCSYYNTRLFPVVKAIRWINQRRGQSSGAHDTDLSIPPRLLNRWLEAVFAGEAARLAAGVDGQHRPYARGVSLVALLEKQG